MRESPNAISKQEILTAASAGLAANVPPSDGDIDRTKIPWEKMIPIISLLPTEVKPPPRNMADTKEYKATRIVGLYEGAVKESFDVFRGAKGCKMRSSIGFKHGYCDICKEWIKYRIAAPTVALSPSIVTYQRNRAGFKAWLAPIYP